MPLFEIETNAHVMVGWAETREEAEGLARKRGGSELRRTELRDSIPAATALPEERLLARERSRLIARVLRGAQGEQGARNLHILRLAAVEGYTSGEISRQLGGTLTASSVGSILCRLRQLLAATRVVSSPLAAARSTRCS